jgi:hypothetical protein
MEKPHSEFGRLTWWQAIPGILAAVVVGLVGLVLVVFWWALPRLICGAVYAAVAIVVAAFLHMTSVITLARESGALYVFLALFLAGFLVPIPRLVRALHNDRTG